MSEPTQTNRKKSRRRNGDGNTYRHKNGWRTVISHKGHTVTAMGRSEQESRRLAKEKIKAFRRGSRTLEVGTDNLAISVNSAGIAETFREWPLRRDSWFKYPRIISHVCPGNHSPILFNKWELGTFTPEVILAHDTTLSTRSML